MELVQLCMKKRGIRFFAKIPKEFENTIISSSYKSYFTKRAFSVGISEKRK